MPNPLKLLAQAGAARERSHFARARRLYRPAAALAPRDPELALEAWQGVADCGRLLGDFKESIQAYRRALREAPKARAGTADPAAPLEADLMAGLGLAYRGAGQARLALRQLQ